LKIEEASPPLRSSRREEAQTISRLRDRASLVARPVQQPPDESRFNAFGPFLPFYQVKVMLV
ncbi:MAG TPA: hypothetical protein VNV43_02470, partial [Candidatus Acidoferrales bacterium]|nr:hypothetical protein [Candidatus Acidoferrales bacterium]